MKKKGTDPTVVEVAGRAGVSIATVSRVLNDPARVRPSTASNVMRAMDELGYPYNRAALPPRSEVVIVVLPSMDNPFYAKIIKGMQSSAKSHGLEIMVYPESNVDAHAAKLTHLMHAVNACGLILLSPVADAELLAQLDAVAPLVQCAEYNEHSPLPYVSVDDFAAAKNAMETLIRRGRKRIALINGPEKYKYSRQRYLGYADALKQAGLPVDPALTAHVTEMGFDSSLAVARQMLLHNNRPDAILATSDMFAAAVVKAASYEGISIPRELSLIGFDNTFISHLSHPSVTAVNMPQFQLGYMACEVLAERIKDPASTEQKQYLLKTELVLRDSV